MTNGLTCSAFYYVLLVRKILMMNKVPDGTRYRSAEVRSVIITHHHFDHWLMVNSERTARVRWKKSDRLF